MYNGIGHFMHISLPLKFMTGFLVYYIGNVLSGGVLIKLITYFVKQLLKGIKFIVVQIINEHKNIYKVKERKNNAVY